MSRQPPPRRTTKTAHLTGVTPSATSLTRQYRLLGTWEAVGREIGISGGMAFRVATQDYKPSNARARRMLRQAVAADYDSWLFRNMAKLQAIVAWAELPKSERVWPIRR